jgi:hypothetical protein
MMKCTLIMVIGYNLVVEVDLIVSLCWETLQVKFLWVYVCISKRNV